MRRLLAFLVMSIFSLTCYPRTSMELDIQAVMQKYRAIGLAVVVLKNDSVIYSQSFGFKNREDSVELQQSDLFRIASISKSFVGTAVMQLVEIGRISLDDDVNQYLEYKVLNPKFPETPITIGMLLSHRSSINDSQGYKSFDVINPATNSRYAECYNDNEPGSKYTYSNLNYNILGAIVENASGERFDRYILNYIMNPLALHGSYNVEDLDSTLFVRSYQYDSKQDSLLISNNTYQTYRKELSDYRLGYSTPILSPAGGMKISALELAQYMRMHMNNGFFNNKWIIHRDSERLMRKVPLEGNFYALSFFYSNSVIPGEKLIGHNGGAFGTRTAMFFHPEKKFGFVVFCNGYTPQDTEDVDMRYQIIRILYNNLINISA